MGTAVSHWPRPDPVFCELVKGLRSLHWCNPLQGRKQPRLILPQLTGRCMRCALLTAMFLPGLDQDLPVPPLFGSYVRVCLVSSKSSGLCCSAATTGGGCACEILDSSYRLPDMAELRITLSQHMSFMSFSTGVRQESKCPQRVGRRLLMSVNP